VSAIKLKKYEKTSTETNIKFFMLKGDRKGERECKRKSERERER